jgi:ftsQ-type POTRA domain protein
MKKTIRTLAIFSLIMSGIYFGKWFIQTDYFKIREIPVSGDNALLKRSIVSKLEKLKGENIVYIDTKKIEKMVKEDVRVKNATIQKVFPSKLKVNIEERKLHAYVKKGTDLFLADSELNLFGYIQEEKFKNIPIVIYTNDESMKDLKIIISKIKNKDLYDMISEIKKSEDQKENKYELVLVDKVKIITDTLVNEKKYDEIYKSYQKIKSDQTIQYIDIRFKYFNVK